MYIPLCYIFFMRLIDIANEAGVSASTVSRILNNKGPHVASKQIQDRVWEIVRRSGYQVNTSARSLRIGKKSEESSSRKTIACVYARQEVSLNDPFFSAIARGIEEEAYANNYVLKFTFTMHDLSDLRQIETLGSIKTRGLAILGQCNRDKFRELQRASGCYRNIIYAGLDNVDLKCDQVLSSGSEAAETAVNHLIGLGHRRIGYLGATEHEIRFLGYKTALQSKGLPFDESLAETCEMSCEGGYNSFKSLWLRRSQITAVFCSNDQTAIGAIKAATELHLHIPKDISIIGIDDIELSRFVSPALTTVHIPTIEIGRMAGKLLIDRITDGHSIQMKTYLPSYLIERESCASQFA